MLLAAACGGDPQPGYEIRELPKVEGAYHWIDAETIRYHPFQVYKVASHDAHTFRVKIFAPAAAVAEKAVDADAVARSYVVDTPPRARRTALAPYDSGLPRQGQWRSGFDLADMNGDGRVDLVHGPRRKTGQWPVVLLGDGEGRFVRWEAASYPPLAYGYGDVAAADFDGDGHQDLALAAHLGGLTALRGDGRGNFTPAGAGLPLRGPDDPGFSSRAIAATDWDGDGRPDLVAIADAPRRLTAPMAPAAGMQVHLFRGGRWERAPGPAPADDPIFGDAVALGDIDGDGRPEALAASRLVGFTKLLRVRDGHHGWASRPVDGLRPEARVTAVALGDLDGDGRGELVLGYLAAEGGVWRAGIDVLRSTGGGWERHAVAADEGRNAVAALATGDLDADGTLDLVALRADGALESWTNDGDGTLHADARQPAPAWRAGCPGQHVRVADLDRDGAAEIVAAFAGEGGGPFAAARCVSGGGLDAWRVVIAARAS